MTEHEVTTQINTCLDLVRQSHDLRSDNDLARYLKISPKTVSFWRNGKLSRINLILAKILLDCAAAMRINETGT